MLRLVREGGHVYKGIESHVIDAEMQLELSFGGFCSTDRMACFLPPVHRRSSPNQPVRTESSSDGCGP